MILDGVEFFFSSYFARVDLKDLLPFVIPRLAFISLAALMIVALSPCRLHNSRLAQQRSHNQHSCECVQHLAYINLKHYLNEVQIKHLSLKVN